MLRFLARLVMVYTHGVNPHLCMCVLCRTALGNGKWSKFEMFLDGLLP